VVSIADLEFWSHRFVSIALSSWSWRGAEPRHAVDALARAAVNDSHSGFADYLPIVPVLS